MADESDEQLLARAATDSAAMSKLLMRHYEALQRVVRRNLPMWMDRVVAPEDVIQETYARAFAAMGTFEHRGEGSFQRWLSRIAKHYVLNLIEFHRAARRDIGRVQNAGGSGGSGVGVGTAAPNDAAMVALLYLFSRGAKSPRQLAADREAIQHIHHAIGTLHPAEYQAVSLRFIDGHSVESTARSMKRTERAVQQLCYRGLKKLREQFRDSTIRS